MTVLLNKEAAAHRLIIAAVRMCDRNDEPLAVHVVAAAALSTLRELLARRGETYGNRAFRTMLFYAALQKQNGINVFTFEYAELDELVDIVCNGISEGRFSSPNDIPGHVSRRAEIEMMEHITGPFNYLKHADRDSDSLLPEDDAEPILATMHAISAFSMLFPEQALPEEVECFLQKNHPASIPQNPLV